MTTSKPEDKYSISRYLSIGQVCAPEFTGDGKSVLFLTAVTGLPQVWRVSVDVQEPAWPDPLTFGVDGIKALMASPVPGDRRLIFGRDSGGNENVQLYLLNEDGAGEMPLTEGYDDAMHTLGDWSPDGQEILFAANRRHPGLFDLYRQRLGEPARLAWQNPAPGFLFAMRFSLDRTRAVVAVVTGDVTGDLLEIDLQAGTARSIAPTRDMVRYGGFCFGPDGRSLLVNTDAGADFGCIGRLDPVTRNITPVVAPPHDVLLLGAARDARSVLYTVNVNGADELYVLDTVTGKSRRAPRFSDAPGVVGMNFWGMKASEASFSPDGRRAAFSFTGATRASDIYVWDLSTDAVRPITRSSHAGLPVSEFVAPELIHYPTFDGRQIPAWYFRPRAQAAGPVPAIVVVHGGPAGQTRPSFAFHLQLLAAHGYAVLAPNVRGSTGYGKKYQMLDEVQLRMGSVADLAHAARWLKGQPDIRGDRIAVMGASYGGFMTLSALATYPDLWAAGIDIVGISNFVTFLRNTSAYRRAHREGEYGSLERDGEFLESISPLSHVDRITAPLMVIHGRNDPRVPLSEAEQLVAALKARGVPVEFLVFDDEGHGIVKRANQAVAYPAIMEFLDRCLKR